jgi:uncharacterized protein YjbJ (UPF0337 family)
MPSTHNPVGILEGKLMGLDDKINNKGQEAAGYVKEGVGKASDDPRLQAEGQKDQRVGKIKQAGQKIKDALKR